MFNQMSAETHPHSTVLFKNCFLDHFISITEIGFNLIPYRSAKTCVMKSLASCPNIALEEVNRCSGKHYFRNAD